MAIVKYTIRSEHNELEVEGLRLTKDFAVRYIAECGGIYAMDHVHTGIQWPLTCVDDARTLALLLQGPWSDFTNRDPAFLLRHAKKAPEGALRFALSRAHYIRDAGVSTPMCLGEVPAEPDSWVHRVDVP